MILKFFINFFTFCGTMLVGAMFALSDLPLILWIYTAVGYSLLLIILDYFLDIFDEDVKNEYNNSPYLPRSDKKNDIPIL